MSAPAAISAASETGVVASQRRPKARRSSTGIVLRLILTRLLTSLIVLFVVTFVIFLFVHAAPGGPELALAGVDATPEQLAAIRAAYHLDDPLVLQYFRFISGALGGDLGASITMREPVITVVSRAATSVTLPLIVMAWMLSVIPGVTLGYLSARKRGSITDRVILTATILGATAPVFAVGMFVSYVFGIQLGWLPFLGAGDGGLDTLRHLVLPAVTIAVVLLASATRVSRVRFIQVIEEDQYTFARARGLSRSYLWTRVVLKNAAVHLITWSGSLVIGLIAGLIIVEQIYGLPGIGTLLIKAIGSRDIPLIQGITLLIAIGVVLINLVVDLLCIWVDPRIRKGMEVER